jgi:hypothetical protein
MNIKSKYIKCFSKDKSNQLKNAGFIFLYERNGVYYFENNINLYKKFSNNDLLKNTKLSKTINF